MSVVQPVEERRALPAPPPPPKPVMIIVKIAMTMVVLMTYWKQVRLDSSLRAPPGLVKLRQKIQLHTTKLKPTDYVGFSKLPYQVGKQTKKLELHQA